jgi:hypothetical protein
MTLGEGARPILISRPKIHQTARLTSLGRSIRYSADERPNAATSNLKRRFPAFFRAAHRFFTITDMCFRTAALIRRRRRASFIRPLRYTNYPSSTKSRAGQVMQQLPPFNTQFVRGSAILEISLGSSWEAL